MPCKVHTERKLFGWHVSVYSFFFELHDRIYHLNKLVSCVHVSNTERRKRKEKGHIRKKKLPKEAQLGIWAVCSQSPSPLLRVCAHTPSRRPKPTLENPPSHGVRRRSRRRRRRGSHGRPRCPEDSWRWGSHTRLGQAAVDRPHHPLLLRRRAGEPLRSLRLRAPARRLGVPHHPFGRFSVLPLVVRVGLLLTFELYIMVLFRWVAHFVSWTSRRLDLASNSFGLWSCLCSCLCDMNPFRTIT